MIILGIDPGTATTGYGVIKKIKNKKEIQRLKKRNGSGFKCIVYNTIQTKPIFSAADRLNYLHKELTKIIKTHQPTAIAVESLFFFKNTKTALPVSQARGVILMTAAKQKIDVYEFSPLEMKMTIAGYGRADKKEVQKIIKTLLNLQEIPKPDDAADALGIALCCAFKLSHQQAKSAKKRRKTLTR